MSMELNCPEDKALLSMSDVRDSAGINLITQKKKHFRLSRKSPTRNCIAKRERDDSKGESWLMLSQLDDGNSPIFRKLFAK